MCWTIKQYFRDCDYQGTSYCHYWYENVRCEQNNGQWCMPHTSIQPIYTLFPSSVRVETGSVLMCNICNGIYSGVISHQRTHRWPVDCPSFGFLGGVVMYFSLSMTESGNVCLHSCKAIDNIWYPPELCAASVRNGIRKLIAYSSCRFTRQDVSLDWWVLEH
jgi:hypothetical protein